MPLSRPSPEPSAPTRALRLGFDARMIRHSGIGTYSRSLLARLGKNSQIDLTLFGDLSGIADYPALKVSAPFPIYSLREQIGMPALVRRHPLDLLHVPHYNAPLGAPCPLIVTIHDLIHLKFPPSRAAYFYARAMMEAVVRKSRRILADSRHTLQDLVEVLGADEKKIRVLYPAVPDEFQALPSPAPSSEPPYALYVGNLRATKNIPLLIQAFLEAQKKCADLRLVLAGKNSMPELTRSYEGREDLKILGEVSPRQLLKLFQGARLFVFPSLYEGFGLPPLEAMALGIPVLCSNAASLPEVVGDAARTFDPRNAGELASLLAELWTDEGARRDLVAKGRDRVKLFSWDDHASELVNIYGECVG